MPKEPRTIPIERITPFPDADIDYFVKRGLARAVCAAVRRYFEDPENRKEFEKWHLATYGKSYVWKYEEQQTSDDLR